MYNDEGLTREIRARASAAFPDLLPEAICVNCSHTHNSRRLACAAQANPTAAYLAHVAA